VKRTSPLRLGLLVSGGGRTALNLHEHVQQGALAARIEVVVCSRGDAPGAQRCLDAGLPIEVVDRRFLADDGFHQRLTDVLASADIELVCMAGFLSFWRIPPQFAGRVINIHPALLPAFGGKGFYGDRVHRAVLASGMKETGCTVHFADNEYDHGPIILQRRVLVLPSDDVPTLAARVFAEELIAYPEAVRLFTTGVSPLPHPALARND
jgi:formyltetrahydrofolate-dependent phosphoribosylglycinamide formyltransferase